MADMDLNVGIENFENGTNILKVEVPDHLRRRIVTKLDWADEIVGGQGWTPSSVYMLTGTPGAGKTTAMLQLADRITGMGHMALFNTGEESLYQVKLTAERLALRNGFVCGQETFTMPGNHKETQNSEGLLPYAERMYNKFVEGKTAKDGSQKTMFLLIDSLQTLNDGKYGYDTNGQTEKKVCEQLCNWAKKMQNVVLIFIGQVTKDGTFAGKNVIKHAVDGHIHMYIDEQKKSETFGMRLMSCKKNRFGSDGTTLVIDVDTNGISLKGKFAEFA